NHDPRMSASNGNNNSSGNDTNTIALSETEPLSTGDKERLRASAERVFEHLEELSQTQQVADGTKIPSWIGSKLHERSSNCHYFDMHGFCLQREFCTAAEVQELKAEMARLVEEHWHPGEQVTDSFGTDAEANMARGDYFLDSADRISYFAETQALQEDGTLKAEYQDDKLGALNKAGHGMHTVPGSAFSNYTLSDKMKALVKDLGWQDPFIPQSMYIFKQPTIGGTVHSHQDSTFLYTTPKQSCLGLWLALDDATLENGCLWVRPQSHREPVRRQFMRNPDYDFNGTNVNTTDTNRDYSSPPKLVFEDRNPTPEHLTWEGGLPRWVDVLDSAKSEEQFASFVPVEVKAGDLVVFCGTLDHFSLPNFSKLPRHTFQLHLVEGPNAGVEWAPQNWLQYPMGKTFLQLR
ncbi:MAG: hypothetical protein SGILL_000959, partial [Bacillariaceae sp.]